MITKLDPCIFLIHDSRRPICKSILNVQEGSTAGTENEQFNSFDDDFLCFDQRSSDRASKSAGFCINMRTHHLITMHGNKPVFVRCIGKKPHAFIPLVVGERDSESAYLKDRVEDACWWKFGSVPTCGMLIVYFKPFRARTSLWSVRPQRTWLAFFLGRIQEHAKQTALWSLQSSQEGRSKVRHLSILSSCDRQHLTVKQIEESWSDIAVNWKILHEKSLPDIL